MTNALGDEKDKENTEEESSEDNNDSEEESEEESDGDDTGFFADLGGGYNKLRTERKGKSKVTDEDEESDDESEEKSRPLWQGLYDEEEGEGEGESVEDGRPKWMTDDLGDLFDDNGILVLPRLTSRWPAFNLKLTDVTGWEKQEIAKLRSLKSVFVTTLATGVVAIGAAAAWVAYSVKGSEAEASGSEDPDYKEAQLSAYVIASIAPVATAIWGVRQLWVDRTEVIRQRNLRVVNAMIERIKNARDDVEAGHTKEARENLQKCIERLLELMEAIDAVAARDKYGAEFRRCENLSKELEKEGKKVEGRNRKKEK